MKLNPHDPKLWLLGGGGVLAVVVLLRARASSTASGTAATAPDAGLTTLDQLPPQPLDLSGTGTVPTGVPTGTTPGGTGTSTPTDGGAGSSSGGAPAAPAVPTFMDLFNALVPIGYGQPGTVDPYTGQKYTGAGNAAAAGAPLTEGQQRAQMLQLEGFASTDPAFEQWIQQKNSFLFGGANQGNWGAWNAWAQQGMQYAAQYGNQPVNAPAIPRQSGAPAWGPASPGTAGAQGGGSAADVMPHGPATRPEDVYGAYLDAMNAAGMVPSVRPTRKASRMWGDLVMAQQRRGGGIY